MSPDTIDIVKERWHYCNAEEQDDLIRRYLLEHEHVSTTMLLEFLAREFAVAEA